MVPGQENGDDCGVFVCKVWNKTHDSFKKYAMCRSSWHIVVPSTFSLLTAKLIFSTQNKLMKCAPWIIAYIYVCMHVCMYVRMHAYSILDQFTCSSPVDDLNNCREFGVSYFHKYQSGYQLYSEYQSTVLLLVVKYNVVHNHAWIGQL